MAQIRVNGASTADQFLTGSLTHFVVEDNDGANIAQFGFDTSGDPWAGEEAVQLISTVVNPVILESANAQVMYFAAEVNGVSASDIADAINSSDTFGTAAVSVGTYTVV